MTKIIFIYFGILHMLDCFLKFSIPLFTGKGLEEFINGLPQIYFWIYFAIWIVLVIFSWLLALNINKLP